MVAKSGFVWFSQTRGSDTDTLNLLWMQWFHWEEETSIMEMPDLTKHEYKIKKKNAYQ
jgi:hypothetical protein